jgi:hypothetical protein
MRGEEIMGVHYLHTWVKGAQGDGVTLHTVMVGTRSHPGFRSVLSGTSSGVVHSSQK